ncbi:osomolarity two-component system, response regulator SSK1 [Blastomyces parvus]|uniref:Osomolarity two-component system, response regulator SSK1 n=1 Tax=Blastomyces parvus TaxID=2060905 RepID=A0A2B7XN22_9EURO|nr:osomolarity two-component system, response regulator SSK1 [Blastomyces parvus]
MDRERRLSRLTAKLLRRSSSSSANFVVPNSPSPSTTTTTTNTTTSNTSSSSTSTTTPTTAANPINPDPNPTPTPNAHPAAGASPASVPVEHDHHHRHHHQPQLHLHPPPHPRSAVNSSRLSSASASSSPISPTDDSSDLRSPLAARRLHPRDQAAPLNSTLPDHQQQPPLPREPPRGDDEEIAEHVDQFPAVSFQSPTAAEGVFDAESSARSSSSSSRALDPKEDRLLQRPLEAYSLSRASSKDKGSHFRSARQSHPRSSVTSTSSLNFVDESRRSNTPLSTTSTSVKLIPTPTSAKPAARPSIAVRRQSLVPSSQQRLINTLLDPSPSAGGDYFSSGLPSIHRDMIHRKIWVKRPNSSPTLVAVTEDDLVDDLRDVILKKYSNSLGRTFDSPDIIIKLLPREPSSRQSAHERVLGPEEPVGRTLDTFYPGGQTVDEALIIEIPQRRTPKPSPRQHNLTYCHSEDLHPGESGEYFPPMAMIPPSNVSGSASNASAASSHHAPVHSMSVITTGQLPPVPSPGSRGSWHQHQLQSRPKYGRQHTSSPTVVSTSPNQNLADTSTAPINGISTIPPPPSMSTPPAPSPEQPQKDTTSPPARTSSPRPTQKLRKAKNRSANGSLPMSLLDGTVPPINVLIVEDNIINLRLLEAFMKRLKVRWSTAMNGREAVNKWRAGGFHLVLMDIQLPVLSGLEATKEIRRYERLNNIGVFSRTVSGQSIKSSASSSTPSSPVEGRNDRCPETLRLEDKLENPDAFKSPVIIVALTASSLQSDRNEALAAGCNDFLTKPVNMVWLEQKVTEWGCMQALIDFEGWRKWRKFDEQQNPEGTLPTTTTTPNTTTIPEPTGQPAPLQHKKSQQNIHVSSNGGNGGNAKTVSNNNHYHHNTDDHHDTHNNTHETPTNQDGATPVIPANPNPIKQVPAASASAKEATSNASSSAASATATSIPSVANGSSKLDATSPSARSGSGASTHSHSHSSAAKRTNRNNNGGGVSPRMPRG